MIDPQIPPMPQISKPILVLESAASAESADRYGFLDEEPGMILGLRTVGYHVSDLAAAKTWYASVVGHAPYFDEPFYVGFEVGGFELGLIPDGTPGPGGCVAFWGVPDIDAEVK